jgi:WD40 repeat protein
MSLEWKNVYVFISSTFNDMHAERDYLVKRVFPDLREWCEQRKLRLIDIDLRWGVTEADAASKRALKVCLQRINNCRPFFLCFLGQRHGWAPGKDEISHDTFQEFPELKEELKNHPNASITELEIRHAIFRPFAWHDPDPKNTGRVVSYEPAKHSFFYLRDPGYLSTLRNAPRQLLTIYTDDAGPDDETKNEEAVRLASRKALDHLRSEIQSTGKLPQPPIQYSVNWREDLETPELSIPQDCPHTEESNIKRWRRTWNRFAQLGLLESEMAVPEPKRSDANKYNAAFTKGRLTEFSSVESARGIFEKGTELAAIIEYDLQQAILIRYPERKKVQETGDLQRELDQQEEFIANSVEGFVERPGDFDALNQYVEGDSRELFVLTAPGGMGKSTLLGKWVAEYRKQDTAHARFIGQSDGSSSVYSLIRYLLREIKEVHKKLDAEIPEDPNELRRSWPDLLNAVGHRAKTVIVIDALNQLESGLSDLTWLSGPLPENIKMIVSFKVDDDLSLQLNAQMKADSNVWHSEVKPFADKDREKLVDKYLDQYWKDLDSQLLKALIESPGASNPLYLKVVLSELRVFGAFANLSEKIQEDFGNTPVSAFDAILARLESDPAYSAIAPKQAVPLLFGLLAHARHGLSTDELTGIFIQALKLPDSDHSRQQVSDTVQLFLRQVRPFLARRERRFDYFYESFKIAAQQRYMAKDDAELQAKRLTKDWHRLIANYFENLPTWKEPPETGKPGDPIKRKVVVLPYHLTFAQEWKRLKNLLCDLDFLEAKLAAGGGYDLLADFMRVGVGREKSGPPVLTPWVNENRFGVRCPFCLNWNQIPEIQLGLVISCPVCFRKIKLNTFAISNEWKPTNLGSVQTKQEIFHGAEFLGILNDFSDFVQRQFHLLGQDSTLLHQMASNEPKESAVYFAAMESLRTGLEKRPWLQRINSNTNREPCLMVLSGHEGPVLACEFSPDGTKIVSASQDHSIKLWDAQTGQELRTVVGHKNRVPSSRLAPDVSPITCCGFSPDSRFFISGAEDGILITWNVETGAIVHSFPEQKSTVSSCCFSPDGMMIVSGYEDGTLILWDAKTAKLLAIFSVHTSRVSQCVFSPAGNEILIAGSNDCTLKILDVRTGNEASTVYIDDTLRWRVLSCEYSPDGKQVVCGMEDGTVRIWTPETSPQIAVLSGHMKYRHVTTCAFYPDGSKIVTGSADKTLRIWNAQTREMESVYAAHSNITRCSVAPDGLRIATSSGDGKIRIWDAHPGRSTSSSHFREVNACTYSVNGDLAFSASGDNTVKVWDTKDGRELSKLEPPPPRPGSEWETHRYLSRGYSEGKSYEDWVIEREGGYVAEPHHLRGILAFACSPDGQWLASASKNGTIQIWRISILPKIRPYEEATLDEPTVSDLNIDFAVHGGSSHSCCYSPDGRFVCSADYDNLKIWDLHESRLRLSIRCACSSLGGYSPDGALILCTSSDGRIILYDSESGDEVTAVSHPDTNFKRCLFTPDGMKVFAFTAIGEMRILRFKTQKLLTKWHIGGFDNLLLSSSDGVFVFCTDGGTGLGIFEARSGRRVGKWVSHGRVSALAPVSSNGKLLIGDASGNIYFLQPFQFPLAVPIVTAGRLYRLDQRAYDSVPSARCPLCNDLIIPEKSILDLLQTFRNKKVQPYPCLHLPDESWKNPVLRSRCGNCRSELVFNPFLFS